MDFLQCMELDSAQALIRKSIQGIVLEQEPVELIDALGRVTAEDLLAGEDLPLFSRSSVDGFAVRSSDTFGASEGAASLFAMVGEVLMGCPAEGRVGPGQAIAVPTGGMLPEGADSVVMLEYTEQPDLHTLLVQRAAAPGENVVQRGEDIACGAKVIESGKCVTPQDIGLMAACGYSQVMVRKKIRVAVLSSGDELVEIDETPVIGQVRDVNSHALAALIQTFGCEVRRMGIVRDDHEFFLTNLRQAVKDNHLVVISGGSSVGAKDFSVSAIESVCTGGILLHGLAIKPGKPTIFGMAGKVPVFGLPGHPVAALTVCGELVKMAIRQMYAQGEGAEEFKIPATLSRNIASAPGRDDFVNVRLIRKSGGYIAEPLLGKSGLITMMAKADGVLHIQSAQTGLYEGDLVWITPIARPERK